MSINKVMLVYPYFYTGVKKDQIFPPLGIALLSAILKQKGMDVLKLDCTFLSMDDISESATKYKPDITGIYIMTTLVGNTIDILGKLKEVNPSSLYFTGGPLPTLFPERFAEIFDLVFRGEAAYSLPAFCGDYFNSENRDEFITTLDDNAYPGLFAVKDRKIDTPPVHLTKEQIDSLPLPDRDGDERLLYQRLSQTECGRKRTSIMTTYGCPFACDFCSKPIFGDKVKLRNLDNIFEEIRDILSKGYDSLWIADDIFTLDMNFLKSFCDRLLQDKLNISWSCLSRVDNITGDMAALMKKSGCVKVYLGIESGNDDVLKLMNKNISTATAKRAVKTFTDSGIECSGFFIVGYPGETQKTIEDTLAFSLNLGLDEISFNVPYPLPGSKLYERVVKQGNEDWTIENEIKFLYKSEFDVEWLKKRIEETYASFAKAKIG